MKKDADVKIFDVETYRWTSTDWATKKTSTNAAIVTEMLAATAVDSAGFESFH